ncbi:hypothetical protein Tco_1435537 [Tanacetum coccineum]
MPRFSLNDMVHNHYLEEAKKKTQERGKNSRPSMMPSAKSQSTANGSKPKPRSNTQTSRNWPASKTSCVTKKTVPITEHSRNSRNFSNSNYFVCSTCQKSIFNANHDSCVTKFLNKVNSRAKKPTGRILKTVGLRWVPTGKIFASSTTKVDGEAINCSNADITNQYEYEQTLDVNSSTLNLSAGTSFNPEKEGLRVCSKLRIHDHSNEPSNSKLIPKVVPSGTSSVNKSSSPTDNSKQYDIPPTTNIQYSTEPITPTTNVYAEENNNNQAADTQFQQDEFINPFCTPVREIAESSSRNINNSNMHTFYQPYDSEYRWTKDHPLE